MSKPEIIAISLITFYPGWYKGKLNNISHTDKIRGDLALDFIGQAIRRRYQLVVVDGKSSPSFQKELSLFTKVKIVKRRGTKRSPAKRQAFRAAANLPHVKIIIACEPEKISLLENVSVIAIPIIKNKADIVVVKRNDDLFRKTYPEYMCKSEMRANLQYNRQLRKCNLLAKNKYLDFFFGPRAFRNTPEILELFTKKFLLNSNKKSLSKYFDPEELSNTLYFPIVSALKKGLRVKSVEVPFSYPYLQKANETIGEPELFIEKRLSQRLGLLTELSYFIKYLQK